LESTNPTITTTDTVASNEIYEKEKKKNAWPSFLQSLQVGSSQSVNPMILTADSMASNKIFIPPPTSTFKAFTFPPTNSPAYVCDADRMIVDVPTLPWLTTRALSTQLRLAKLVWCGRMRDWTISGRPFMEAASFKDFQTQALKVILFAVTPEVDGMGQSASPD
jgi:hypothetical protein